MTNKLIKLSYLCAKMEALGLESIANKIANNSGIQKIAQYEFSAAELSADLKTKLSKILLKTEKYHSKKAPKGVANFKRIESKNVPKEDRPKIEKPKPQPAASLPSLANVDFITEKMPKISYQ